MKVSREQAALNRERIVEVAGRLFRERGYDGIGVADLMRGAGLTHGGFYGHFDSKEDLLAEACGRALEQAVLRWQRVADQSPEQPRAALAQLSASYLSKKHVTQPELGCSITTLGADAARLGPGVRQAMTAGARGQIGVLQQLMPGADEAERRRQALVAYSGMIGAVMLARMSDDAALSAELLQAMTDTLA
ncbi:TetR/AcrR family transcriptional regulator [Rugamonas sp.]|uniref:TetR/AcrR family transcriptional regulator n=1 Tax=Rugamonas sp. TaxID=1926287 RepID=UPI0025F86E0E|nr:TetR/AcrR family transcriptional regulator [Rugamonas sp.]